jgi:hypothetical protein
MKFVLRYTSFPDKRVIVDTDKDNREEGEQRMRENERRGL